MNVMEMFSLKGKVALVTGAGNRIGYGAQCAEALYEAGAEVYIASRNLDKLNSFAANYPGMKVLQFGFSSGDNEHLPHNFTNTNCFAYTGTHDNETLNGWVAAMDRNSLKFAKKYLNVRKKSEIPMAVIRAAWGSIAEVAAAQMQDFLDSPKEGRMNTPSTLGNNWQFRTKTEQFTPQLAKKIKKLNKIYNR